jgi:hypothetical protein
MITRKQFNKIYNEVEQSVNEVKLVKRMITFHIPNLIRLVMATSSEP